ncbi:hypothetical protein [Rugosimonospora africana]|uniref:Uncharacterized protein n=1 Tax=Rugosimonospora africana TaxID=556532 RepID=A0A8J3QQM5_9ACTN|nr:hypothetical protein [Rugosimonospora africana]GIH13673.1 hypothetical protein Raf01_18450 [Rugosimonospora africana]
MSEYWWSIEVLDGGFSAELWRGAHGNSLIEAAVTRGAVDWNWERHSWGTVFEIAFRDSDAWAGFRILPAVTAALDAVPDPVNGLMIYQGRGGSSSTADRRRPKPRSGAGAAELPREPDPVIIAALG